MAEKRNTTKKNSRVSGGCRSVGPVKDASGVVGVFSHTLHTCQALFSKNFAGLLNPC